MANSEVHTGFWIDHTRGRVLGATLTLEAEWGSQLVSAAAILVQVVGCALWSIIAFAIHHQRSTPRLRDEYDAQLQVLLRNTSGAESSAWNIFNLGRTWQGRKQNVWRSAGTLTLLPALVYGAFLVAGIFVGQIATNSYNSPAVLLQPGACGFIDAHTDSKAGRNGFRNLYINESNIAQQYARSCHSGPGSLNAIGCSVYPVQALNYTIELDQPCPVPGGNACFSDIDTGSAMKLTTKALDSHYDLGINAPAKERVTLQYSTTCAPLDYSFVDKFVTNKTVHNNDTAFGTHPSNATIEYYKMGNWTGSDTQLSYTVYYAPIIRFWGVGAVAYSLNAVESYAPHNTDMSGWMPAAPFNQVAGDLSLFFLAPNGMVFSGPVSDPMFRTFDMSNSGLYGDALYVPARNLYLLACSETRQLCNPTNHKCTGWNTTLGLGDFTYWQQALDMTAEQNATFARLALTSIDCSIFGAVDGVPNPLLASVYQWRTEVEGWFQNTLAKMQFQSTVFVNNPLSIVEASDVSLLPANEQSEALGKQCKTQRVTAPQRYQSYNLFALVFIAVFGLVIPSIAFALKAFHHKLPSLNPQGHRYLSYQAEGLMQLHRMALEGAGYGGWEDGPRTGIAQERIPQVVLDYKNHEHDPMLRYPTYGKGGDESDGSMRTGRAGYAELSKEEDEDLIVR